MASFAAGLILESALTRHPLLPAGFILEREVSNPDGFFTWHMQILPRALPVSWSKSLPCARDVSDSGDQGRQADVERCEHIPRCTGASSLSHGMLILGRGRIERLLG